MKELDIFKGSSIKINGKEYEIKYTLASWVNLEKVGITPSNLSEKFESQMLTTLTNMIYYGISKEIRSTMSIDDFAESIDMGQLDELMKGISSAVGQSMPEQKVSDVPATAQAQVSEPKKN